MKRKVYQIILLCAAFIAVVIFGCNKDEEEDNQAPTCAITQPAQGQEFTKGDIVTIEVVAIDPDGDVTMIQFFSNGSQIGATSSFPFHYDWNTSAEETGSHTLKATATDNRGNSTSDEISLTINDDGGGGGGPTFTDPRDNQTYKTIIIGGQEWLAENLNYETGGSWCYGDSSHNCEEYGRLYTWDAAINACPAGWHLPSDEEWKTLELFLGMPEDQVGWMGMRGTDQGRKLKSTTGWVNDGNGTDEVGFNSLPAGKRINEIFFQLGAHSFNWSATLSGNETAWARQFMWSSDGINRTSQATEQGYSVRCVKN